MAPAWRLLHVSRSEILDLTGPRKAGALPNIFTLHTAHRAEHFHAVRLGAVLLSLHVVVGPSKIRIAGAIVLFIELAGQEYY